MGAFVLWMVFVIAVCVLLELAIGAVRQWRVRREVARRRRPARLIVISHRRAPRPQGDDLRTSLEHEHNRARIRAAREDWGN